MQHHVSCKDVTLDKTIRCVHVTKTMDQDMAHYVPQLVLYDYRNSRVWYQDLYGGLSEEQTQREVLE